MIDSMLIIQKVLIIQGKKVIIWLFSVLFSLLINLSLFFDGIETKSWKLKIS